MKLLVSTKVLAQKLAELDLEKECVQNVVLNNSILRINTQTKSVEIWVDVFEFKAAIKQDNRRWDCLKLLLAKAPEQPVVLQISENTLNVIFQY